MKVPAPLGPSRSRYALQIAPARCALLVIVASLLVAAPMTAQVASGTISGSVTDSTGAVIPGAAVQVINTSTSLSRAGRTDERGQIRYPFLPVGTYSVSAELEGFKKFVAAELVLQVDQTASIRVVLEPGDVFEVVEVSSVTPLLESETSDIGQVIENKKIVDLPLNGRNPFALGLLAGNTQADRLWRSRSAECCPIQSCPELIWTRVIPVERSSRSDGVYSGK